jgi:hypothetical protein
VQERGDNAADDRRSPVEQRLARSLEDPDVVGRPLSRRARQTQRTVEAYLKGGGLPRYMERALEIEREVDGHRRRLEREYQALRDECGADAARFARRWRARARSWPFDRVNDLIRQHNEWYPVERDLPIDLRTRDYVPVSGRSYRRAELGPKWVLEQFPPSGERPAGRVRRERQARRAAR